ncbi:MAG: DUF1461 domain-containing protein [Chloroflexota bacterium]|nr:DUF1461 domain-containing protein [Chloroflexota bacterium]MDE3101520.1 DUF1461 domain-containing protein [Chloroflexota bacterium]
MSGHRTSPSLWLTALFALAFAWAGVVGAVFAFAPNESVYRSLVVPEEPREIVVRLPAGGTWSFSREMLVFLHRRTVAYVLSASPSLPTAPGGAAIYTANESSHFADVRRVFDIVRAAAVAAGLVVLASAAWARRRGYLARLVRNGAIAAALLVVVIAAVFAVAFEPAFLAFHYLFFPEGNFLFDPATSNMLLVYPERYWYGITLRIGVAFIALAAIVAGLAALGERRASAIVPTT